jgi:sulfonate transport system substrate-binding protein
MGMDAQPEKARRAPGARASLARALAGAAALVLGCARESAVRLALDAPIPDTFPKSTELRLGDPTVQKQLELTGGLAALPFSAGWQNLSGGPQTIEAFRAGALDGGSVGDTPPIHALFTGLDVKIVAVQVRDKPGFRLALAPGVHVATLEELRGKSIAYSPGQAQGALVLRVLAKAGLRQGDVRLVQLLSSEFKDALSSRQVDVAPLSGTVLRRYLGEYAAEGASAIEHHVADGYSFFYVPTAVLEDANKAAALREYVKIRTRSLLWSHLHPEQWIDAYYVRDQGLSPEEGRYVVDSIGEPQYPRDWSEAIARTQQTVDLLAEATQHERFDAARLFDRRFEAVSADARDEVMSRGASLQGSPR